MNRYQLNKCLFLFALMILSSSSLFAQDDLLNMLQSETPAKPTPIYATFKSTRVVNLQSNETMKANHLDFRIQHRFGSIEKGAYDFFGLDAATNQTALFQHIIV